MKQKYIRLTPETKTKAIIQTTDSLQRIHALCIEGDINYEDFEALTKQATEMTIMRAQIQSDIVPTWLMKGDAA